MKYYNQRFSQYFAFRKLYVLFCFFTEDTDINVEDHEEDCDIECNYDDEGDDYESDEDEDPFNDKSSDNTNQEDDNEDENENENEGELGDVQSDILDSSSDDNRNQADFEDNQDNFDDDIIDNDDVMKFIQQSIRDNWSEGVEIDPDDPSLTGEQKTILSLITKCRSLINMIKKSSVLTLYFNNQRTILKIKHNMLRDVCTRWNSTFLMIYSLRCVRPALESLYNNIYSLDIPFEQIQKLNKLEISTTEWNYLNQLYSVLMVFHKATKAISARKYPTIGSAYLILIGLKSFLTAVNKDNDIVKNMKKLLLNKFIHYFEEDSTSLDTIKVSKYK